MKLTMTQSDPACDWYCIERAEHDGRTWFERTQYGLAFMTSARISNADIEGSAVEMLDLAEAIERREERSHGRCAVDATTDRVRLRSPRNSTRDGECTRAEADELAAFIRAKLAPAADGAERV